MIIVKIRYEKNEESIIKSIISRYYKIEDYSYKEMKWINLKIILMIDSFIVFLYLD
jgi:hypothetical protein